MRRIKQFHLRSREIPFGANKAFRYHLGYKHFLKHINSKISLFLAPADVYEIQLLMRNLNMKSAKYALC